MVPWFLREISLKIACKLAIKILRLVTYFLLPALERIKNTYCMGKRPVSIFLRFRKTEVGYLIGVGGLLLAYHIIRPTTSIA